MPEPTVEESGSATEQEVVRIFSLPFVNDNSDGWGPNNLPEKYKDLPYQKFSKVRCFVRAHVLRNIPKNVRSGTVWYEFYKNSRKSL